VLHDFAVDPLFTSEVVVEDRLGDAGSFDNLADAGGGVAEAIEESSGLAEESLASGMSPGSMVARGHGAALYRPVSIGKRNAVVKSSRSMNGDAMEGTIGRRGITGGLLF
jgi:hypothetical protein